MVDTATAIRLWVVVPCFNEERGLGATLQALQDQSDPGFDLVLVDNASTDGTLRVMQGFQAGHPGRVHCVHEAQKGTGRAADTGFRFAIAHGATHVARTDADCLPDPDWVAHIKRSFLRGAEFVAGRISVRTDEHPIGPPTRLLLALVGGLMSLVSPWLPHNRGPQFKCRYVMAGGGNLALTATLYVASGGFPHIGIEEGNDDRMLVNRVRTVGAVLRRDRSVHVRQSSRRILRYGIRNTVLWYWNRRFRPEEVDIR